MVSCWHLLLLVALVAPVPHHFDAATTDLACATLTTCDACRTRRDCTWCLIARGQPRCDPLHHLHLLGNECIAPIFRNGADNHVDACSNAWETLGHLTWENAAFSNPAHHPITLILKAPTFGQRVVGSQLIRPRIEIQLTGAGTKLEADDELCFWVHHAIAPIHDVARDIVAKTSSVLCDSQSTILAGTTASLPIPREVGSFVVAMQVRVSKTKVPRSGVVYTLIDRYPVEIHEWGDLFREDHLVSTKRWGDGGYVGGWWLDKVSVKDGSGKSGLGSLMLYHNQASSTSLQLRSMPLLSLPSDSRRILSIRKWKNSQSLIPKIMHQIWTGGEAELEVFEQELSLDDKKKWFREWRQSCIDLHPKETGWTHYFWDLKSMRAFVQQNFPAMLAQYDNMNSDIKRTDLFRMLCLLVYGGVYVDIDFECLKPFESAIRFKQEPLDVSIQRYDVTSEGGHGGNTPMSQMNSNDDVVSPWLYLSEHTTNLQPNSLSKIAQLLKGRELPNAFAATIPWHPMIWLVVMEMLRRDLLNPTGYVLETTGPLVFNAVAFSYLEAYQPNVVIFPIELLFPVYCFDKQQMRRDAECIQNGTCREIYPNSIAIHHYVASWYTNQRWYKDKMSRPKKQKL